MTRLLFIVAMLAVLAVSVPEIATAIVDRFSVETAEPSAPAAVNQPEAAVAADPQLSPRKVSLAADPRGHFLADADINGRSVSVMVDTGATIVALNEATAVRLGVLPPRSAFTQPVSTVNGMVKVAPVTLSEIRLNGISIRDVPAIVVPGLLLETNLLGMSFLGKLSRFEVAAGRLVLVQ